MSLEKTLAEHGLSGYRAHVLEIIEQVRAAGVEGLHQEEFDRHFVHRYVAQAWGGDDLVLGGHTMLSMWIELVGHLCQIGLVTRRGGRGQVRYFLP